jgi:RecB family exonuclease
VTDVLDPAEDAWRPAAGGRSDDNTLVGTLVHRLFQFAAELPAHPTMEALGDLAARLIRPEERAMAADADASVARAIDAWTAMRARPGVTELLESGERIHELPFSSVADGQPGRILRGTIDCLVHRPDGSIVVVEFKTGTPSPSHQAQLDLYVRAVRNMFPASTVTGRVVYPR